MKKNRYEAGSELITLCFALPLLMFVCAMIISFAQIAYASDVALGAASAGARVAILQDSGADGRQRASEVASAYLSKVGMGVEYISDELSYSSWDRENICVYSVEVSVKTAMPMSLGSGFKLDSAYHVKRSCPMMIERK